jgi:shikimate dehydrogenase
MSRAGVAVLGSPIAHSLSPILHQAAYDALDLPDWSCRRVECVEADLVATMRDLEAEGLAGVGLTMPLKRAVMPMLASCDDRASSTGAANTVRFGDAAGQWQGANTDVPGMVAVLSSQGAGPADNPTAPYVLGAGATAGSALAAIADLGYRAAVVLARRPEATDALRAVAKRVGLNLEVRPWGDFEAAAAAALLISTTPAGATDELADRLPPVRGLLFDVIYVPWPTPLAAAWSAAGGQIVGGLELLVEQAVEQVRLLTGRTPPAERLREAGYAALGSH